MSKWWVGMMAWVMATAVWAQAPQRVVTLGGSVTEIVYRLGQGDRLVGDDLSSMYPDAATRLPRIGYYRAVPVEGVLALSPGLVLASEQAGPPDALTRLNDVGVRVVTVSDRPSVESLTARIRGVAEALDVAAAGEQLITEVSSELAVVQAMPSPQAKALVLFSRNGTQQAAGQGTAANEILTLAGLTNVLADQQGYKPLSAEAVGALAPDIIIITQTTIDAVGSVQALLNQPGLRHTPAGAKKRVIVMDDLLILGMGPRLPAALRQLKTETARALAR